MNKKIERYQMIVWGVLFLGCAAAIVGQAQGEDPKPTCLKCIVAERGVPILSKIPYLSKLFKNVATSPGVERAGIALEFKFGQDSSACKTGVAAGICESTPPAQLFVIRKTAHGQAIATCCKDEPCCGKECAEGSACCEADCEADCEAGCEHSACVTAECGGRSWERIIELTAKSAALEAVLEARESFDEEKSELIETLAMSMVEKAKLEGKVETLAQQAELTKEMLTLVAENSRLKAQVEAAESKLTLIHEMAKLAIENEQLKLALKTRHGNEPSADVQYFPPGPEYKASRVAPAKKASFQEPANSETHPDLSPPR